MHFPISALASDVTTGPPVGAVLLALAVLLVAAKIGAEIAVRLGHPAVLGELLAGVLLGNLGHLNIGYFEPMKNDPYLGLFAQLGVLVLLFEVGIACTVRQMLEIGLSALLVAATGVGVSVALGWAAAAVMLPTQGTLAHLFLGAAVASTSIGITARVLHDLGAEERREARVILGAAVLDDVLGLILLAVMMVVVQGHGDGHPAPLWKTLVGIAQAVVFLGVALVLGAKLTPRLFDEAARYMRVKGVLLALGLSLCFFLAWLAGALGLAPIIGAFSAGLILEATHSRGFVGRGEPSLEKLIAPISSFLVPIFFLMMGMRTDLRVFAQPGALVLALVLFVVAVAGKLAAGLGARGSGDWLAIAIGMIPRGEVSLIFAGLGLTLQIDGRPLLDATAYSAIVAVVIGTTLIAPPLLKWRLGRTR